MPVDQESSEDEDYCTHGVLEGKAWRPSDELTARVCGFRKLTSGAITPRFRSRRLEGFRLASSAAHADFDGKQILRGIAELHVKPPCVLISGTICFCVAVLGVVYVA